MRSKTRMSGWPSFWLLFLGHSRKSDAPCKAQPVGRAEESAAPYKEARTAITISSAASFLRTPSLRSAMLYGGLINTFTFNLMQIRQPLRRYSLNHKTASVRLDA
ncbi:hypothetical protein [Pseudomonas sp. CBC3]|uniref:hypothetical protein n=1 Tax=Pseudomonas sp. CBC3 TaxID=3123318 RepID=UPI0030E84FC5